MSKFGELINSKTPVLIHYAVDHVPECVEIQHILESVAEEMGNKLTVIKIDILKK